MQAAFLLHVIMLLDAAFVHLRCKVPTLIVCMLQHEAALTKAEETLEEDTAAFDKFLKESDEKVQQAMSRADAEMKAKQEKVRLQEY